MLKKRVKLFKCQKGFTLIELLVVVAIVGILTAVAMPRFFGVLEEAKVRADESNVRIIETAAQIVFMENGVWPAEGLLNDAYNDPLLDYLEEIPEDPWKDDGVYEMLADGKVTSLNPNL